MTIPKRIDEVIEEQKLASTTAWPETDPFTLPKLPFLPTRMPNYTPTTTTFNSEVKPKQNIYFDITHKAPKTETQNVTAPEPEPEETNKKVKTKENDSTIQNYPSRPYTPGVNYYDPKYIHGEQQVPYYSSKQDKIVELILELGIKPGAVKQTTWE